MLLRDVEETDLPILFEHQLDPEATAMAAFPAREQEAFMTHWARILGDETVVTKTIDLDGCVAGSVVSFEHSGRREVGYWLGRQYWGRGVATRALAELLSLLEERPLYAYVARHNVGSRRVLEKCGFAVCEEDAEGFLFELGATARSEVEKLARSSGAAPDADVRV